MENLDTEVPPCRTCLGAPDLPINLLENSYEDYLDVLQRLLGFKIYDYGHSFHICRHCEGKLIWVTEFQRTCLKSLQQLRHCKTESADTGDPSPNNSESAHEGSEVKNDYTTFPEIDQSNSDNDRDIDEPKAHKIEIKRKRKIRDNEKSITTRASCHKLRLNRKRRRILVSDDSEASSNEDVLQEVLISEADSSDSAEDDDYSSESDSDYERVKKSAQKRRKIVKSKGGKPKRTKNRPKLLKQYPAHEVFEAFRSARKYLFDIKNRQCLICDFVGRDAGMLQTHTHRKHEKEFRKWCKHCNMMTQNLVDHREEVKCYEQKCELCGKAFTKMKYLKTHLQQHCDTKLFQDFLKEDSNRSHCDQYSKIEVLRAIADSTAYVSELKYRNCLFCDYVVATASLLPAHMSSRHKEYFKTWCARCNLRTDDLQSHIESARCNQHLCVFCNKVFDKVYKLTAHLKLHCRTMGRPNENDDCDADALQNDTKTNMVEDSEVFNNSTSLGKEPKDSKKKRFKEDAKSEFKSLYDQFPEEEVTKALADCTAFLNDDKHKICVYCQYAAPTSINLSSHMRNVHMETFKDWCRRCNLQTTDLQLHIDSTKCCENRCVFCNKTFDKNYSLTRHLKSHCREKFAKSEELGYRIDDIFGDLEDNPLIGGNPNIPINKIDDDINNSNDADCNNSNVKAENALASLGEVDDEEILSDGVVSAESSEEDVSNDEHANTKKLKAHGRALKQFPRSVVQRAIVDSMKSYYKNRKCIKCEFLTTNRHRLITHMNSAHRDVKGKWCNRCNAIVVSLGKHWSTHENDILKCVLCGIKFKKTELLKDHLKRHYHSKVGSKPLDLKGRWYCCMACPSSFPEEELLKTHKCKDSSTNTFVNCKLCKRHVRNLRLHNAQKHRGSKDRILSDKTPKVKQIKVKTIKVKAVKQRKSKSEKAQSHLCPVCGKTFKTSAGMTAHVISHSGETNFKCSICGKCFPNITKLSSHERRHSGVKPFVCHICGKGSFDKLAHTKHLETHEGGPVQCTICNKEFPRPGVLKLHMRQHTGENKFNCVYCAKSFHIKSLLTYHMRIHNEDRPYKCSFCGKGFKEDATLRNHEKIHTGQKPFKCSICTFSAVQPSALTTHMKQHPEDAPQASRPHKCQFCYRSFSTNALLMSHTELIHKRNTKKYVNKGM